MLANVKKLSLFVICTVIFAGAFAQANTNVVTASFSGKVNAEVWVSRLVNGAFKKLADYQVSPSQQEFMFVIPKDSAGNYRFQINLQKKEGRHFKTYNTVALPLTLNPANSYTLKVVPSKLDAEKKTGWELRKGAKPSFALVSGKVNGTNPGFAVPITFQSVKEGKLQPGNTLYTNSEGKIEIASKIKWEGFYYLSSPRWRVRVFLKPSEKIELSIDNKTGYVASVKGSMVNQTLYQWQQLIAPITRYGYNVAILNIDTIDLDAYMREYEKLQPSMNEFINNIDVTDAVALKAATNAMELDKEMAPLRLLYNLSVKGIKGYRPRPSNFKEVPGLYKGFIGPGKFSSASILALGEAREYMNLYAKLNLAALSKEERERLSQVQTTELMMRSISNDTLKSLLLNDLMEQMTINNLSEFKENIEPFKKYAKLEPTKTTYQSIYNMYSGDTAFIGKSSYNFALPDTSGKMVSMKDFKGKVVFIDVWATWCGPCKAQMPFLKEIEEEYKDNENMVFVGISLDKAKDEQKWRDFVKKEALHGIQLLDADWKAFAKKYGIAAIPRFMLIDKNGKWMEVRCPLPQDKKNLKRYLDKALAEEPGKVSAETLTPATIQ